MTAPVQFAAPAWLALLVLLVPIVYLARHSLAGLDPRRRRLALGLRVVIVTALVCAVAGLQWVRRIDAMSIVYVLDRSASLPEADQTRALAFARDAAATMRADDTAGAVVTARTALLERTPTAALELPRVESRPDPSFTDLGAGLRLAAATARPDARRRAVLFSDGDQNLGDALAEARRAAAAGVGIDVVPLRRSRRGEVVAERLVLPAELAQGDALGARLVVRSDLDTPVRARLLRDNAVVAEVSAQVGAGKTVVAFPPVTLDEPGFHAFAAELDPAVDGDRRNNRALGFTLVRGRPRVLYVEGDAGQAAPLRDALTASGLAVTTVPPGGLPATLPGLAGYDALILSNVSALDLAEAQLTMIRSAVRDLGLGLVMLGGDRSFGVGGWFGTPVEDALPVEMDIHKLRRLPSLAVAVVIDKSGSMALTEGGVEKIQLANEAAIALIAALGPEDQVAVIPTDSQPRPVGGGLFPVSGATGFGDAVARIRAGGGGIYCYAGLKQAAELVRPASARLKHILLFADASDSEQQQGCDELVRQLAREKITVSVVGLGHETDVDTGFLRELARLGGGRFYLTNQASKLPRIFTREAILASRSPLVERTVQPRLQTEIEPLRGITALPPLRGYVATTARPQAEVGLLADGPYAEPILAVWQYGLGRSLAFTSDAKARWAADWVRWPGYAKFWSQAVRWVLPRARAGGLDLRIETRLTGEDEAEALARGEARVVVDAVDPAGGFVNGLTLHGTVALPDGASHELALSQTAPGRYEASFRVDQVGIYLVNVAGEGRGRTAGLALAWPPEYGDVASDDALLAQLAEVGGGQVLTSPEEVFRPRGAPAHAAKDAWPGLLLLAALLFPFDVAVRRVVALPRFRRRPRREAARPTEQLLARRERVRRRLERPEAEAEPEETFAGRLRARRGERPTGGQPIEPTPPTVTPKRTTPTPPDTEPPESSAMLERLKAARKRARGEDDDSGQPGA